MSPSGSPAVAERLERAVANTNLPDCTPETLLASFEAEGIRSLEDVARRLSDTARTMTDVRQPLPIESMFTAPSPQDLLDTIVHPVPTVPFVVDGVEYDPADISRFDGQELGFIPQAGGERLLILKDKAVWGPFLRTVLLSQAIGLSQPGMLTASPARPAAADDPPASLHTLGLWLPPVGPNLVLWTDTVYKGYSLTLYSGESRRNLLEVGVWPWLSDFNDKFSSVYPCTSLAMGFEHIHFAGSYLWLGRNEIGSAALSSWGWNDRISSVINSG